MSNPLLLPENQQFVVVVPAAGVGKRMLASCPKQYLTIKNESVLSHTINRLLSHKSIAKVIVAISDEDDYFSHTALAGNPNVIRVSGGKERVGSVLNGLKIIEETLWVLVHDAARPCVTHDDIDKLISQCLGSNCGGILSAPVVDTMKVAIENEANKEKSARISETIDRSLLWHAFTPQMFKINELKQAIEQGLASGLAITDESSAIEYAGLPSLLVLGRRDNIKITRPEDLALASFYLDEQQLEQQKLAKNKG